MNDMFCTQIKLLTRKTALKVSLIQIFEIRYTGSSQRGLNKKEIQLNLCNIFSIFIFNELYLFT